MILYAFHPCLKSIIVSIRRSAVLCIGALLCCLPSVQILAEVLTCSHQFAREVASLASKVEPGSETAAVSGKKGMSLFIFY